MPRYLVFLRGVNVGGKRLPMADLRAALQSAGFADVVTHLQSGNVVLTSPLGAAELGPQVEAVIERNAGVHTDVIVRTVEELAAAVDADPFASIATDPSRHVLGLMAGPATSDGIGTVERQIAALPADGDRYAMGDKHFYLWCPNGISASPYFKVGWHRLGVSSTQRNWNTVTAMLRLAQIS